MNRQIQETKAYLQEVLGVVEGRDNWGEPWSDAGQLPFYIQDLYTFNRAEVLGRPCLLMICRASTGETPAVVRKHWMTVSDRYYDDVIYVVGGISSYNRKRLIEQRVPFLVPGNQMYLPMLGIDFREHFKHSKKKEKPWLSAAAQVLVLREILGRDLRALPAKELALSLGYSAMTLTRAIKELVNRELATAEMVGREKRLEFNVQNRELWQKAEPNLHSPVKKSVWVAQQCLTDLIEGAGAKIAGESALAEFTTIAHPKNQILAVNASEWPGIKKLMDIEQREERDFDCAQIQLWRYSPTGITNDALVDPLSLWLSFENTKDERLEMARDELLEKVWGQQSW
jgi:DNA-binding MarR family transcriptional regulator